MKRFKNILCALTPEESSRPTLERALSLAENNQAQLTVIDVIPQVALAGAMPGGFSSADLQSAIRSKHLQTLEAFTETCRRRYRIQHDILTGTGFLEITRAVLRNGYDLVIKPAENPGFVERLFGSDDMHLLRKCPCPVWLTKPDEKADYDCILAAVDFDPENPDNEEGGLNRIILELSASLAISDLAALHLVHAWDAPGEMVIRKWGDNPDGADRYVEDQRSRHQTGFDRLQEQLKEQIGTEAFEYLSPGFHMHRGRPSTLIPDTVRQLQANLVVMGTVARSGVEGLLIGNTAETILGQLQCSVLAIKPPGFICPVRLTD